MKSQFFASLFDCLSVIGLGMVILLARKRVASKIPDPAQKQKVERILMYRDKDGVQFRDVEFSPSRQ